MWIYFILFYFALPFFTLLTYTYNVAKSLFQMRMIGRLSKSI